MEVWINERRPEVMCMANVTIAFVVHVAVFLGFFLFAYAHFKPKETIIPISLTFTKPSVEMPKPSVEVPTRPVDVPAISQSSGFGCESHLKTLFKKRFGTTMSGYRAHNSQR